MQADPDLKKIEELATKALELARDELLLHLRFFASALARLTPASRPGYGSLATDGDKLFFDPVTVLSLYRENPVLLSRTLLHVLLHCLFAHPFHAEKLDRDKWDVATDAAVESVIVNLKIPSLVLEQDSELQLRFKGLKQVAGALTAERIYRYFVNAGLPEASRRAYEASFHRDDHRYWGERQKLEITQEQWEQLSRRIRTELKAFSKDKTLAEALEEGLGEATKRRYDYAKILERFLVMGEQMGISPDEFDYVYYSYGLSLYGDLPLIEPLEYREERRIRDFVIAIDTSASVSGKTVKAFLRRTVEMLMQTERFFSRVNIHVVQCDSEVQSDTVIRGREELEGFLEHLSLRGFGGTDFRPVFNYVSALKEQKEFTELKGMIYFTDGYGIYPERKPPMDVLFVFLNEDEHRPPVPLWAMKAVLEAEELKEYTQEGRS
ncbi:MAG: VWA-like domain-containing protein [Lachnospiraceae bacterium]|nr:VWA-like domain-containing protein [Lachnospiraceae bacterium]